MSVETRIAASSCTSRSSQQRDKEESRSQREGKDRQDNVKELRGQGVELRAGSRTYKQ
jgi:hypothetical protein